MRSWSDLIGALLVAAAFLAVAYHVPAAVDQVVSAAESRAPVTYPQLAKEYSRQIFKDDER